LKVECDDWYGRNLDAKQRDVNLELINVEKRLALVEEELAELKQEQSNPVPKSIRGKY
jgi:hypothetical protein